MPLQIGLAMCWSVLPVMIIARLRSYWLTTL
jgi:hypothetical protein